MSALHLMPPPDVIVISPVWVRVAAPHGRVRVFPSVDAFEHWRAGSRLEQPTFGEIVDSVLEEAGASALPPHFDWLLGWLRSQPCTPCVKALIARSPSRRSFYRAWPLRVSPADLLARVRRAHTYALLASGHTAREAAIIAGYGSMRALVRDLRDAPAAMSQARVGPLPAPAELRRA